MAAIVRPNVPVPSPAVNRFVILIPLRNALGKEGSRRNLAEALESRAFHGARARWPIVLQSRGLGARASSPSGSVTSGRAGADIYSDKTKVAGGIMTKRGGGEGIGATRKVGDRSGPDHRIPARRTPARNRGRPAAPPPGGPKAAPRLPFGRELLRGERLKASAPAKAGASRPRRLSPSPDEPPSWLRQLGHRRLEAVPALDPRHHPG